MTLAVTKTKTSNKLAAIATTLYSQVTKPGTWERLRLPNGLELILHRIDEQRWRLAMAREDVYPSDTEVGTIRDAFGVPEAAEEARGSKQYKHPKSKRMITYQRVELFWTEA